MKQSISKHIIDFLREKRDWQIKGAIFDRIHAITGCYSETCGRKCRLLTEQGEIERMEKNRLVYYRIKEELPDIKKQPDEKYINWQYEFDNK